jgi:hypothetical protein
MLLVVGTINMGATLVRARMTGCLLGLGPTGVSCGRWVLVDDSVWLFDRKRLVPTEAGTT